MSGTNKSVFPGESCVHVEACLQHSDNFQFALAFTSYAESQSLLGMKAYRLLEAFLSMHLALGMGTLYTCAWPSRYPGM